MGSGTLCSQTGSAAVGKQLCQASAITIQDSTAIMVLGTGTLQKMPHVFSAHDGCRQEHLYQQASWVITWEALNATAQHKS